MQDKFGDIYALEQAALGRSPIHRLHPGAKIAAALCYIAAVISFDRYSFSRLLPFLLYPSVLIALAELSPRLFVKPALAALPFCLFAGLSNLFLERTPLFVIAGFGPWSIPVTRGFVSLCTLLLRSCLCVAAVLILAATTPFHRLSAQLRRFHIPALFITVIEIMYRYMGVLAGEVRSMVRAYTLRGGGRGIAIMHMGSFIGQLLIRSVRRAERIYAAMQCRGYAGVKAVPGVPDPLPFTKGDGIFLGVLIPGCLLFRLADLPLILGKLITGPE
ncbi:MAG: cobalt ECF transporter T component CbiQ [Treponema sp.]|jgi:cobalt/nickel transport system permease protein|nr:cobalt ECF transporter T component CbiQ [Treponema sp.]